MRAHLIRAARLGAIAAALAAAPALGQATFRGLGTLQPDLASFAYGISPDGSVVVGRALHRLGDGSTSGRPVQWLGSGIEMLPGFDGVAFDATGRAASAGGGVIIGEGTYHYPGGLRTQAFRTQGGTTTLLPLLPGSTSAWAHDITPDGAVIVGSGDESHPLMWLGNDDPIELPIPAGTIGGRALGVSADATRVVGSASILPGLQDVPFLWTAGGGTSALPTPAGYGGRQSVLISADGGTVVGNGTAADFRTAAYRWTEAAGLELLPMLPGAITSSAYGCSADGSVIVGAQLGRGAVIWRDGEVTDLTVLLGSLGVDLTGWTLTAATAVSADGLTIAGNGQYMADSIHRTEAWMVTIPGPGAGVGLVVGALAAAQYGGRRRRKP